MIDKETLKKIIQDLRSVLESESLFVSHEVLFENAAQYHRGMLASGNKERKIEQSKSEPITDKQGKFLSQHEAELITLGFDLNNIQNKSDAFKVISEYMKLKGVENEKRRKKFADY